MNNQEDLSTVSTEITAGEVSKSVLEPGVYSAVCIGIADLGLQTSTYDGQEKVQRKVSLAFALNTKNGWGEIPVISRKFTLSFNEKATLAQFITAWKVPNEKLTDLLGKSAQIVTTVSEDGKYNNLTNILPPKEKVQVPAGIFLPSFWFDRGWKVYPAAGAAKTRRPKVDKPDDGAYAQAPANQGTAPAQAPAPQQNFAAQQSAAGAAYMKMPAAPANGTDDDLPF